MTKEAENRLLQALERTAQHVDQDGLDPNAAIVKAAGHYQIPAGHIKLMVHAYNTGRTNAQRLEGETVAEKAASFALADTSTILEALYPKEVQTPAEKSAECDISSDYSRPPSWARQKAIAERKALASGYFPKAAQEKVQRPPTDREEERLCRKTAGELKRLENKVDEARQRIRKVSQEMDAAVDALELQLRTSSETTSEVFENAKALWGKTASVLEKYILQRRPELVKKAGMATGGPAVGKTYELVEKCVKLAADYESARAAYSEEIEKADDARDELLKPYAHLLPEKQSSSVLVEDRPLDRLWTNSLTQQTQGVFGRPFVEKQAFLPGIGTLGTTAKNMASVAAIKEMSRHIPFLGEAYAKPKPISIMDPAHESELRAIQVESMLSDLLSNDEVLSESDPGKILEAYNELAKLAPRAAEQKSLVRSMLRKNVSQGTFDVMDLNLLSDIEKRLKETLDSPNRGYSPEPVAQ